MRRRAALNLLECGRMSPHFLDGSMALFLVVCLGIALGVRFMTGGEG